MPGKDGKDSAATKPKKPIAEEETLRKAAVQHAKQVQKDNRKLKPKAFVKKFDEELGKVIDYSVLALRRCLLA